MSINARFTLVFLKSKGKKWEAQMHNLQEELGLGRDALRKVFKELEARGHATLVPVLGKNGKWAGKRWRVVMVPRQSEKPTVDKDVSVLEIKDSYESKDGASEEEWCRNPSPSAPDSRLSPFDSIKEELSKPSILPAEGGTQKERCLSPSAPIGRCEFWKQPTQEDFTAFIHERGFEDFICSLTLYERFSNPKATKNWWNMDDWRGVVVGLYRHKMRNRGTPVT